MKWKNENAVKLRFYRNMPIFAKRALSKRWNDKVPDGNPDS